MKLRQVDSKKIFKWAVAPVLLRLILVVGGVQACSNGAALSAQGQDQDLSGSPPRSPQFRLPAIPAGLMSPEQRADYLALHYWDGYDFADTSSIASVEKNEQILSDYIAILPYVSDQMAQASLFELLSRAEKNKSIFLFFAELLEKYLYDPNSPFRNEEYYLYVLRFINVSPALGELQKIRFAHQLKSAAKNRKGTKAANFSYTLADGRQQRMYDIPSDYLLIYFNNPGCQACQELQAELEASPVVSVAVRGGLLKILAVYPDEDLKEWQAHQSRIPAAWLNAYDAGQAIKRKGLYDLRAIPSLYLLDNSKTVLIKDGTVEQVERMLGSN